MISSLPPAAPPALAHHNGRPSVGAPLSRSLRELRTLLSGLTPAQYGARAGDLFADGTIGGHVRHCLDHARALCDAGRNGIVDYDHRTRGTSIETDPAAAGAEIERLIVLIEGLSTVDPDHPLGVSVMTSREGESVMLRSSLARELAFVLSHTIHHNAIIRGIALSQGRAVPDSFGFAPSTLAHRDASGGTGCAR